MTESMAHTPDAEVEEIEKSLSNYKQNHPLARIDIQRRHEVSIHIRIIDPDFEGTDRVDREPEVRKLLDTLDDETFQNVSVLLLLAPSELDRSLANMEFENPVPSRL